jgi:hypothetical protein
MRGRSRDAAYWRYRIERDHPEIARRLSAGELPSVRAAAIEAGLIHEPSGLVQLRRAWRRASPDDRVAFMAEVGVADLVPRWDRGRQVKRRPQTGQVPAELGDLFAISGAAVAAVSGGGKSPASVTAIGRSAPQAQLSGNRAATVAAIADTARPTLENAAPMGDAPGEPRPAFAAPTAVVDVRPAQEREAGAEREVLHGGTRAEAHAVRELRTVNPAETAELRSSTGDEGNGGTPTIEASDRTRRGVRRLFGLDRPKRVPNNSEAPGEAMTPDGRVRVGQRYIKVDAGPVAWEVLAIFPGPLDMPHVRISSVEEPDTIRVVSVAALLDRRRYQLTR